jgi:hypothetical protein
VGVKEEAPPRPSPKGEVREEAPPQPSPKGEGGKTAINKMKER